MMRRCSVLKAAQNQSSLFPVPASYPAPILPGNGASRGYTPDREPGDPIILLQDCCEIMATFVLLWGLGFLICKMEWGRRTAWFSWVSTLAIPGAYAALGSTFQLYGFQGEFVSN